MVYSFPSSNIETFDLPFQSEEVDRGRHFVRCHRLRDRRKLYRVSAMAQKLFYVYRELTWAQVKVKQVEKIGDNLVLRGSV
jgi:hypothetical protein